MREPQLTRLSILLFLLVAPPALASYGMSVDRHQMIGCRDDSMVQGEQGD